VAGIACLTLGAGPSNAVLLRVADGHALRRQTLRGAGEEPIDATADGRRFLHLDERSRLVSLSLKTGHRRIVASRVSFFRAT
jgi:hypothetical protein